MRTVVCQGRILSNVTRSAFLSVKTSAVWVSYVRSAVEEPAEIVGKQVTLSNQPLSLCSCLGPLESKLYWSDSWCCHSFLNECHH